MDKQECKGCSASVYLGAEDIYEIIRGVKKNIGEGLVEEETYKKRLEICQKCPDLLYNTTCKFSGYIIYVLAKDQKASCYNPGNKRW